MSPRPWLAAALALAGLPSVTPAQSAALTADDVRLRPAPSTHTTPLRVLSRHETLTVVGPDSLRRGFYHVRTRGGEIGWVAGEYLRPSGATTAAAPPPSAPMPPQILNLATPAGSVSAAWTKPPIHHSTFKLGRVSCGYFGSGTGDMDRSTNERKNRSDTPASYHAVAFDAVTNAARLPWPSAAPTNRDEWTDEQLAAIARFEGVPITVTGFIRQIKPQRKSSSRGESTNCGQISEAGTDWHVAFVGRFGDPESASLVVEVTPRFKKIHGARWARARLAGYENPRHRQDSVRVSGWLMFDPRHVDHIGRFRRTLWEIHPVTRIEVFRDSAWVDLDDLP